MPAAVYMAMNHGTEAAANTDGGGVPMWAFAIIVIFMMTLVGFLCFCIGTATDIINNRRLKIEEQRDGWLLRPFSRFACGAFYGHKWTNPAEFMNRRGKWQICMYCGKVKVIKEHGQHGA